MIDIAASTMKIENFSDDSTLTFKERNEMCAENRFDQLSVITDVQELINQGRILLNITHDMTDKLICARESTIVGNCIEQIKEMKSETLEIAHELAAIITERHRHRARRGIRVLGDILSDIFDLSQKQR